MSTSRFATVLGLALGAVWALAGFSGAFLAGFLALVGFLVAQVLDGRIDLSDYLGERSRR